MLVDEVHDGVHLRIVRRALLRVNRERRHQQGRGHHRQHVKRWDAHGRKRANQDVVALGASVWWRVVGVMPESGGQRVVCEL